MKDYIIEKEGNGGEINEFINIKADSVCRGATLCELLVNGAAIYFDDEIIDITFVA